MDSIIIVPLYDTLGMKSIEYILNQTEMTTIILERKKLENILKLKEEDKLNKVKNIIYLKSDEEVKDFEENKEKLIKLGINVISYETIISTGKKCLEEKEKEIIEKEYRKVRPEDIFLICYTSGTIDNPKGAMITARSLSLATNVIMTIGYHLSGIDRILSFLPLAHIMEQIMFTINITYGTQTGFYSGDTNRLIEDMRVDLKDLYNMELDDSSIESNVNTNVALIQSDLGEISENMSKEDVYSGKDDVVGAIEKLGSYINDLDSKMDKNNELLSELITVLKEKK
jgi:long-subunit acyl-CoA synthetase (AMP-forming)